MAARANMLCYNQTTGEVVVSEAGLPHFRWKWGIEGVSRVFLSARLAHGIVLTQISVAARWRIGNRIQMISRMDRRKKSCAFCHPENPVLAALLIIILFSGSGRKCAWHRQTAIPARRQVRRCFRYRASRV